MPQLMLINPRKRRKNPNKKRRTANRHARNPVGSVRKHMRRNKRAGRRPNPSPMRSYRRRNPALRAYRRRRNPSGRLGSLFNLSSYLGPFKDAAIQGVGAVAFDVAHGYLQPMLPASIRRTPGTLGLGDAVYAIITVALGNLLSGVTRGMSRKAAVGALTVQAHDIARTFLPDSVQVGRVGFVTNGRVIPGMTGRVNSNMRAGGRVGQYTGGPGQSPLLSAYTGGPGQSPLLSRSRVRPV